MSAVGQDVVINDFSGGLATKPGIFHVKPNQARECLNWDLSEKPGALTIRNGYAPVGYKNDTNSLVFLHTHYYRDDRKELFGIAKSDTAAWGTLYRSGDKRIILDSAIYHYVYTGAQWSAVSWKDHVILANGYQRPLVWNGSECRQLTLPAPGEPSVVQIDSTDNLDGEYRYMIYQVPYAGENVDYLTSYKTQPIYVNNGALFLYGFPSVTPDSLYSDTSSALVVDTIVFALYRTKALNGELDDTTYFYSVMDNNYCTLNVAEIDTFTWLDTIPDESLGVGKYSFIQGQIEQYSGLDSNNKIKARRFGMPNFICRDTCAPGSERLGRVQLTDWMLADSTPIIGVGYMMTYWDSVSQIESDSGRVFLITPEEEDTARYYRIGLPPVPPNDTGLQRILYKGLYIEREYYIEDTFYYKNSRFTTVSEEDESHADDPRYHMKIKRTNLDVDTMFYGGFYPVTTIECRDSIAYTDSTIWDSISVKQPYAGAVAPHKLNHITLMGDALWGTQGSKMYNSYLDTIGHWGAWDWYAFNLDDGDEITAIFPDREYITVFKNRSQHVLYQDSDGLYSKKWTVRGRGCVAPNSVQFYDGGVIYLDEHGVYYETAAPAKDKGTDRNSLSQPISDLIDYPISELKKAQSDIYDGKYFLSFPDKDTTYICFLDLLPNKVWGIYDFAFEAATNYDIQDNAGLVPSSDMLFITGSDSAIYKFDTTQTDNGTEIVARWKSGPIARSVRDMQISDIGFWTGTPDSVMTFKLWDSRDSAVIDSREITPDDNHYKIGLKPNGSNYFYIGITNELSLIHI